MKLFRITLLTLLVSSKFASAAVWKAVYQWNSAAEDQYSNWIRTTVKTDILSNRSSPYYGLLPDCADAVYSMRVIFAFEHRLPFAIVNPISKRSLITNDISKFDRIPEGTKRVKAFLAWLYDVSSTQTIENDTYPVPISRDYVRPGTMMLAKESKHSYFIKNLRETGVPTLYYSTQGNDGTLKVRSWPSVSFLFSTGIKEPSGIRGFRRIEDLLKPEWDIPSYSSEQYNYPASRWTASIQRRLAQRTETVEEQMKRLMADVCQLLVTRVELVNKAQKLNSRIGGRCLSASEFDDLSTPSRDKQTKAAYNDLGVAYKEQVLKMRGSLSDQLATQLANIFASSYQNESGSQYCPIEYRPGRYLSLGEIRRRIFAEQLSSNPNDDLSTRWGDRRGPSEKAYRCPTY